MRRMTILVVVAVLLLTVLAGRYAGQQAGGAPPDAARSTFVVPAPATPTASPVPIS